MTGSRKVFGMTGGFALLISGFLFCIGFSGMASAADKEIRVGVVFPLSGSLAQTGRLNRSGTELAIDIINNKYAGLNLPFADSEGIPSLGNAKIKIIWGDTQGNPNVARAEVERLIENEGVVAVLGGWTSADIKTGSQAAERLKTPYVSGAGSSTDLTRRGLKYYFRLCPTLGTTAKSFFQFIDDLNTDFNARLKTIAIAYENTEYGSVSYREFTRVAKERGYKVVASVPFPKDTTSVLSEVMKLKAANPDVFVHAGYISDSILFAKEMENQNFLPKVWYGLTGYHNPTFIKSVGRVANGACMRGFFNPRMQKKVVKEVNQLYMKKNKVEMSMASALTFNTPFVLADAINKAASLDKEAIRIALEKTNIPGDETIMPWKAIAFTPAVPPPGDTHDNKYSRNIIFQLQKGQYQIIWPFNLATSKPIFPLQPYNQR